MIQSPELHYREHIIYIRHMENTSKGIIFQSSGNLSVSGENSEDMPDLWFRYLGEVSFISKIHHTFSEIKRLED